MRIGVVGATGVVGSTLLKILEKEKRVKEILPFSSGKAQKYVEFRGEKIKTQKIENLSRMDTVFFCVDAETSEKIFSLFSNHTPVIIDNSSAFRLEKWVPLVVPEVNPEDIKRHRGLIANPNCSTIQLVIPLKALEKFQPQEVFVATYQSVSGAGREGIEALRYEREKKGKYRKSPFDERIFNNLIPKIGEIKEGHSKEEWKMILESKKILKKNIRVYPTCVRVPIENCHSQAVFVRFTKRIKEDEIVEALKSFPSIKVSEKILTPLDVKGKDEIFISRIRFYKKEKLLSFFCVFDNLRKGAATNAYQIGKKIWEGN